MFVNQFISDSQQTFCVRIQLLRLAFGQPQLKSCIRHITHFVYGY